MAVQAHLRPLDPYYHHLNVASCFRYATRPLRDVLRHGQINRGGVVKGSQTLARVQLVTAAPEAGD